MCIGRTLAVGVGGFLGAVARYWLAGAVQRLAGSAFPWGTFAVNVSGSFLLGLLVTLSLERVPLGLTPRLLLTVGFCGGFTTMSTFSYETVMLLRDGSVAAATGNVVTTVLVCIVGVWFGGVVARFL